MKQLFASLLLSLILNVAIGQEKAESSASQGPTAVAASSKVLSQSDSIKMIQYELQKLNYESAYVRHCFANIIVERQVVISYPFSEAL